MITRAEPLLWIQLLSLGVIPLEMQLIRLFLGASDPGPVPALERIFAWTIAVLAPTLFFWRRPPDWGSLLILSQPLSQRTPEQRQLSAIQEAPVLKVALIIGALLLLIALWKLDRSAILLRDWSPLVGASRVKSLLAALPILSLLLWQWQQTIQSVWLLTRSDQFVLSQPTLKDKELRERFLSIGLPVLQLARLDWSNATAPSPDSGQSSDIPPISLKPEEGSTNQQSKYLDANISSTDGLIGRTTKDHDKETNATGSKEGCPEESSRPTPGST